VTLETAYDPDPPPQAEAVSVPPAAVHAEGPPLDLDARGRSGLAGTSGQPRHETPTDAPAGPVGSPGDGLTEGRLAASVERLKAHLEQEREAFEESLAPAADEPPLLPWPPPPVFLRKPRRRLSEEAERGQALSERHLDELRRSSISPATALAAELLTMSGWEAAEHLGWDDGGRSIGVEDVDEDEDGEVLGEPSGSLASNVLFIPYFDAEGKQTDYFRIKPDRPRRDRETGKAIKYEAPRGQDVRVYFPPAAAHVYADVTVPLLITEGEKKALKATQDGFPTVGLAGVASWSKRRPRDEDGNPQGERKLLPDLQQLPWAGRKVFVVFDSDAAENRNVARQEAQLADRLRAEGAVVHVARLPHGPAGKNGRPSRLGLDDYLVAHGPEALKKLLADAEAANGPPALPGLARTELANARRLVRDHGHNLLYSGGKWMAWDGRRWAEDRTGQAARYAKRVADALGMEAEARATKAEAEVTRLRKDLKIVRKPASGGRAEEVAAALEGPERELKAAEADRVHARMTALRRGLDAMLALASTEEGVAVLPEAFDADPMLLNAENGVIDLKTGQLLPHDRGRLISKQAGTSLDPEMATPLWDKFIDDITRGDRELARYLQRVAGLCLTGETKEQAFLIFYGTGSNGKSTFTNTLLGVLGDYGMTASASILERQHNEQHPTGLTDFQGKRLVAASENDKGKQLNAALVKMLTGGEKIRARKMGQDFYEYDSTAKFIIFGNAKPEISGGDDGIWRRVGLVPFLARFEDGKSRDKDLPEKLKAERPGILAWAVRGALDWQKNGLRPPAVVTEATKEYRAEQDPVHRFIEERCVKGAGLWVKSSVLYDAYRQWASPGADSDYGVLRSNQFKESLAEKGYTPVRKKTGVLWQGINLADRAEDNDLSM
jgi:putative DNA primase/helicase